MRAHIISTACAFLLSFSSCGISGGATIYDKATFGKLRIVLVAPASTNCQEVINDFSPDEKPFSPTSYLVANLRKFVNFSTVQPDPALVLEKEKQTFAITEEDAITFARSAPADAVIHLRLSVAYVYGQPSAWAKIKFLDSQSGKEIVYCSHNTQYSPFPSTTIVGVSMEAIDAALENLQKQLAVQK